MRNIVIACLVGVAFTATALDVGQALAQNRGGQQGKQKERPQHPPLRRCPDLGIGRYAFLSAVPGEAPLRDNEIAVRWDVHNDGNAPYEANDPREQSVVLEFTSPAGARQVAAVAVPMAQERTEGIVRLGQGASWNGLTRAQLPPEARGRRLRLRLAYSADGFSPPINDCDLGNNTVDLTLPLPAPAAAPTGQ
jgi:hypothetical protein